MAGKPSRRPSRQARKSKLLVLAPALPCYMDLSDWLRAEIRRRSGGTWTPSRRQLALLIAAGAVMHESHPQTERFIPAERRPGLQLNTSAVEALYRISEDGALDDA